jgi:hypothetical protein
LRFLSGRPVARVQQPFRVSGKAVAGVRGVFPVSGKFPHGCGKLSGRFKYYLLFSAWLFKKARWSFRWTRVQFLKTYSNNIQLIYYFLYSKNRNFVGVFTTLVQRDVKYFV